LCFNSPGADGALFHHERSAKSIEKQTLNLGTMNQPLTRLLAVKMLLL
jgi:hypothetical protein